MRTIPASSRFCFYENKWQRNTRTPIHQPSVRFSVTVTTISDEVGLEFRNTFIANVGLL
jgi:hypothetical protein